MKTIYSAICFAPDGEHVRDFYNDSKESVSEEIENMGSRWFFTHLFLLQQKKQL